MPAASPPGSAAALLTAAGLHRVRPRYWNGLLLPLMVVQRKLLARAPNAASDVALFPPWLDRSLHGVTELERRAAAARLARRRIGAGHRGTAHERRGLILLCP